MLKSLFHWKVGTAHQKWVSKLESLHGTFMKPSDFSRLRLYEKTSAFTGTSGSKVDSRSWETHIKSYSVSFKKCYCLLNNNVIYIMLFKQKCYFSDVYVCFATAKLRFHLDYPALITGFK